MTTSSLAAVRGDGSVTRCLPLHARQLLHRPFPELREKLCQLGVGQTPEEASELIQETKRFLFLVSSVITQPVPVYSTRIDETWHQFILFTREYAEFCQRLTGHYLHHTPAESGEPTEPALTLPQFAQEYSRWFGVLPAVWNDSLGLVQHSRLGHPQGAPAWRVELFDGSARVCLETAPEVVLCRTQPRARPALRFIAESDPFLVRELPGLSEPADRLELCRALVHASLLRLLP